MNKNMKSMWENLHKQSRFRPKYPAELIVQFVFRNFNRNGKDRILDLGCGAGRLYILWQVKTLIHMG